MKKLTDWFLAQIGVTETGENNVIYNTHFYGRAVNGGAYPWCAAFIWDGFRETGLSGLFCGGEKTAYCPYVMDHARRHGMWVTGDYREGDLLLYDLSGDGVADHIGYCVAWDGGSGVAVEGNYSGAVARVKRYAAQVLGAYRPVYPTDAEPSGSGSASERTSSGASELSSLRGSEGCGACEDDGEPSGSIYTVQPGDSLWSIAEKRLGSGLRWQAIAAVNGLTDTIIYPGQQLTIPGEEGKQ